MNSTVTQITWAKLVSLNPDQQNISLSNPQNESKQWKSNQSEVTIYQDPAQETWIINSSATSYVKVDDIFLEKNQKVKLTGGEKISFSQKKKPKSQDNSFDFMFCLMNNNESNNKLKRSSRQASSELKKLIKPHQHLEDLKCSICMGILYKCATINPCQHNFCGSCLSEHLQYSRDSTHCPLCRAKIFSVQKNLLLRNLLELTLKNSSFPKRTKEEQASLDEKDLISQGYNLLHTKNGLYLGFSLNRKCEGKGKMRYFNGCVYEGEWKNDERHGEGVLTIENGDVYEGIWLEDIMQPYAKIKFSNGNIYEGETKGLNMHGKGEVLFRNGDKYEGDFKAGKREGYGIQTYNNGKIYKGSWVGGLRHGDGHLKDGYRDFHEGVWKDDVIQTTKVKISYKNGDAYEGEIDPVTLSRKGKGVLKFKNGDVYDGNFSHQFDGKGTYTWKEGEIYRGEFKFGRRHGKGTMIYKNGDKFIGNWTRDEREGKGKFILKKGDVYKGNWAKDRMQFHCVILYKNGDRYEGDIDNEENLKRNGKGKMRYNERGVFEGEWVNGKKSGYGVMRYADGEIYEGKWKNNKRYGRGTVTLKNGEVRIEKNFPIVSESP